MLRRVMLGVGFVALAMGAQAQQPKGLVIRAGILHTMAGPSIRNAMVLVEGGKIRAVGKQGDVAVPAGYRIIDAAVVTPGLIDARATVGLSGILNFRNSDQDMRETSAPIQPELRALDAYNPQEKLIGYLRSLGVTTINTGHAPGSLISGQTFIAKTVGATADAAAIVPEAMVSATLDPSASQGGGAPGTRAKQLALFRQELLKAKKPADAAAPRDLRREMLQKVLRKEIPLLVYADRAQDIASALRLREEFGFRMILEGAVEAYLMTDQIKAAGVPVIVHATMRRTGGEGENLTWENAARLKRAGIPIALQSGYEGYVPKVRVVLFEAALAAANGLTFDEALGTITLEAAKILGIEKRVGSIEVGKDADLALYDGDPFEYTSHCIGTVIDGVQVSTEKR